MAGSLPSVSSSGSRSVSSTLPTSSANPPPSPSAVSSDSPSETMTSSSQDSVETSLVSMGLVPPASSTPSQGTTSTSPDKLSTGGIIGAVVAIIGFFWLAALALWWLLRKWRASRTEITRAGGPDWHPGTHRYEREYNHSRTASVPRTSATEDAF